MSTRDTMNRGRSSEPTSVQRSMQRGSRGAGGAASVQSPFISNNQAQRLFPDSVQPPVAPNHTYRAPSPPSVFLPDATGTSPLLQDRPYDVPDGAAIPSPVFQHEYFQQAISEGERPTVAPKEIRINPPRVKHSPSIEQVIASLDPHLRSIILHYSGDSEAVQMLVLGTILEHLHKSPSAGICSCERKNDLPNGGIESATCLLCPENRRPRFKQPNAVRLFAEHLMHDHLHVETPFICSALCGKAFPYSQDRDRHEKQVHKMFRPKAYEALLKKRELQQCGGLPVSTDNAQLTIQSTHDTGHSELNVPQTAPLATSRSRTPPFNRSPPRSASRNPTNATGLRSRTPVSKHRVAPYPPGQSLNPNHPRGMGNVPPHVAYPTPTTMPPTGLSSIYTQGPSQLTGGNTLPPSLDQSRYSIPSTNAHGPAQYPQLGDSTWAGRHHEQPQQGPAFYDYMYDNSQNMMPYLNAQTLGQRNGYGGHGSAQFQPPFDPAGRTVYPSQQQQQPQFQRGSLPFDVFRQNASISSPRGLRPQNGTSAMLDTAPPPAQTPARGAPFNTTTTRPFSQTHGTTIDIDDIWTNYGSSTPSTSNSTYNVSQFTTQQNGNATTRYNPPYGNTNNHGGARWQHPQ